MCNSECLLQRHCNKIADGTIQTKKPHTNLANDDNFNTIKIKKEFRTILVNRAKLEMNTLKTIYDEESMR